VAQRQQEHDGYVIVVCFYNSLSSLCYFPQISSGIYAYTSFSLSSGSQYGRFFSVRFSSILGRSLVVLYCRQRRHPDVIDLLPGETVVALLPEGSVVAVLLKESVVAVLPKEFVIALLPGESVVVVVESVIVAVLVVVVLPVESVVVDGRLRDEPT
jgi:hypothetical protein